MVASADRLDLGVRAALQPTERHRTVSLQMVGERHRVELLLGEIVESDLATDLEPRLCK
jgi:hypothetical protein